MVVLSDAAKLVDPEENFPKPKYESLMDKYRVPVQHFEFSYIETCRDGKELEKIVQILRSGEEGHFPDLTRFAENRLSVIKPNSKLLREVCPVLSRESLSGEEQDELTNDLIEWVSAVSKEDDQLTYFKNRSTSSGYPDVRKSQVSIVEENKKPRRISATDYSSWDKYDPDTEILKMDLEEENVKKEHKNKNRKPKKSVHFKEFGSDIEALKEANDEKEKGNEFYKVGDYSEALYHYTNSINCKPTAATFTNRALTNIKLKKFNNAIDDCHSALAIEPGNIKALLRKAQALDSLGKHSEALDVVEQAIEHDPNNTLAQELASKFQQLCKSETKRFTRFSIEDVEKKKDTKNKTKKDDYVIIPIPGPSNMQPPHYITCTCENAEKINQQASKGGVNAQLVNLIPVDTSDSEDCCTINHLKKICTPQVKRVESREDLGRFLNLANHRENEDRRYELSCIKEEPPMVEKNKTFSGQVPIESEDKCAGGEPYASESENSENLQDVHSPYNFLRIWNSANIDLSFEQHALILRKIDMNRIVEVIGCKLDNSMLTTILKCLHVHFAVPGEIDRLQTILESIVNLPRFEIISMLMSQEDRMNANLLVNFLNLHGKSLSQNVLNKLFLN